MIPGFSLGSWRFGHAWGEAYGCKNESYGQVPAKINQRRPSKIQPLMGALSKPGEPCPGQCCDRCEVGLPLYLGQSNDSRIFSHENNISVDADLIGQTSCLHGAIPFFYDEKNEPS